MKIQHPQNNKGPVYPSLAGIAALAAACMMGAMAAESRNTQSAASGDGVSDLQAELDARWQYGMYGPELSADDALLAPYADGKMQLPQEILVRLQELVLEQAHANKAQWKDRVQEEVSKIVGARAVKGATLLEPGKSPEQSVGEWYMRNRHLSEKYEILGKYAYTDEAMPREQIIALKDLMLKQVRERQELRAKYAPAKTAAENTPSPQ